MSGRIVHDLIYPSLKLVAAVLAVDAVIGVVAALLSNNAYAFRIFVDISTFESAIMMIIGPALLFRSPTFLENRGSKILFAGILLFILSLLVSLITAW